MQDNTAAGFIARHGLGAAPDPEKYVRSFLGEMERGLSGGSSLMMIPTYIYPVSSIPQQRPVAVLDVGGTNLRAGVASFSAGGPQIDDLRVRRIPGANSAVSGDEFFSELARFAAPAARRSDRLSFCFSYATQPVSGGDSRVLALGKQLRVSGVVGEMLGERLNEQLDKLGVGRKRIRVLNDSTAVLLAGLASPESARFSGCVGFILGTGTNSSYPERREIEKLRSSGVSRDGSMFSDKSMIINVESGGYSLFPRGDLDRAFDSDFADEGQYLFEKMVSGRYFSPLVLFVLRNSASEGLFSQHFEKAICDMEKLDPDQPDAFLSGQGGTLDGLCAGAGTAEGDADRAALRMILEAMFSRSAQYCAVNLIAVIIRSGTGRDPKRPVCITADGSVYRLSAQFRKMLDKHMRALAAEYGIYYTFYQTDNETLIGAAAAGLA